MRHLYEDDVAAAARGSLRGARRLHLARCASCQTRVAAHTALVAAARTADRVLTGPVLVPDFDTLLARLPAGAVPRPDEAPAVPAIRRPWRLAVALVARQATLLPRSLAALSLGLIAVATALALTTPAESSAVRLFSLVVNLAVLAGTLGTCTPRRDPRRELTFALPISPATVFLARITLVLAVDVGAALVASAALGLVGRPGSTSQLVMAWLGPSLLSSAVAVVVAVWHSAWLGSLAGMGLWVVGLAAFSAEAGRQDVGLGAVVSKVWTTNSWVLALSLALLALAVRLASAPRRSLRP